MLAQSLAIWRPSRFSPKAIANLELWFDAADLSSLFQNSGGTTPVAADGDPIGCWKDKSGTGRNATQGTSTMRATYRSGIIGGLPISRFDGADDFLALPSVSAMGAMSLFAVAKSDGTTYPDVVIGSQLGGAGNLFQFRYGSSTGANLIAFNTTPAATTATKSGISATTPNVLSATVSNAMALSTWVNGGTPATAAGSGTLNNPSQAWYVGDRQGGSTDRLGGDIGEILVYSRVVSTLERQQIERYLGSKWGIAVT